MTPAAPIARGACLELTESILGGPITENESFVTVGVTLSNPLIEASADRVGLVFVNQGASDVFISTRNDVSTTQGTRLSAAGGSATLKVRDDFTLTARRWYAISGGAGNVVQVIELIRFTKTKEPVFGP